MTMIFSSSEKRKSFFTSFSRSVRKTGGYQAASSLMTPSENSGIAHPFSRIQVYFVRTFSMWTATARQCLK